jgi:hypothetical protein
VGNHGPTPHTPQSRHHVPSGATYPASRLLRLQTGKASDPASRSNPLRRASIDNRTKDDFFAQGWNGQLAMRAQREQHPGYRGNRPRWILGVFGEAYYRVGFEDAAPRRSSLPIAAEKPLREGDAFVTVRCSNEVCNRFTCLCAGAVFWPVWPLRDAPGLDHVLYVPVANTDRKHSVDNAQG